MLYGAHDGSNSNTSSVGESYESAEHIQKSVLERAVVQAKQSEEDPCA